MAQESTNGENTEETKGPKGVWAIYHRVTHHRCYHILQSLLSYLALGTMIAAWVVLQHPPHFTPTVHSATSQNGGVPASNELFDPLAAASKSKSNELEGTEYRYAFANGKSAVRVCTDLNEDDFEKVTGLNSGLRMWDTLSAMDIEQFKKDGCTNTSILAYNSACTPAKGMYSKRGAYYWRDNAVGGVPTAQAETEAFPVRGACGTPGNDDQIFAKPDPGQGFLWTKMIRKDIKPMAFPKDQNISTKNCTTSACQNNAMCFENSCLIANLACIGFVETRPNCRTALPDQPRTDCNKPVDFRNKNGYCDCGGLNKVSTCALRRKLPDDIVSGVTCASVCSCQTNRTTCSGQNKRCSCTMEYDFIPGKPDWIVNNPQFENSKCTFGFGPINADRYIWKNKQVKPCDKKFVHSYGRETAWIVILFTLAIIIRVLLQLSQIYWGCTEDDLRLKILFTTETFMRTYSLCRYGLSAVNDAIDKEHAQGWPWFWGLADAILTSVATLGIAYGADPFPEIRRGRFTLLFLWVSAIREIGKCLLKFKTSFQHKQWYVKGPKKHIECCNRTIWWCLTKYESETKYEPKTVQVEIS